MLVLIIIHMYQCGAAVTCIAVLLVSWTEQMPAPQPCRRVRQVMLHNFAQVHSLMTAQGMPQGLNAFLAIDVRLSQLRSWATVEPTVTLWCFSSTPLTVSIVEYSSQSRTEGGAPADSAKDCSLLQTRLQYKAGDTPLVQSSPVLEPHQRS